MMIPIPILFILYICFFLIYLYFYLSVFHEECEVYVGLHSSILSLRPVFFHFKFIEFTLSPLLLIISTFWFYNF